MSETENVTANAEAHADVADTAPVVETQAEAQSSEVASTEPEASEEQDSQESEAPQESGTRPKRTYAERMRRKISYLAGENETKSARIQELERALESAKSPKFERPDPAKYPNGEFDPKYTEDVAEWKFRTLRAEEKAAEPRVPTVDPKVQELHAKAQSIPGLAEKAREFFEEGGALPHHVTVGLSRAPHGAAVLNHLLSNPEAAIELAEMSPEEALLRIGELNAAFKGAPKKATTKAPPPIKPPSGGAAAPVDVASLARRDDATDLIRHWRSKASA